MAKLQATFSFLLLLLLLRLLVSWFVKWWCWPTMQAPKSVGKDHFSSTYEQVGQVLLHHETKVTLSTYVCWSVPVKSLVNTPGAGFWYQMSPRIFRLTSVTAKNLENPTIVESGISSIHPPLKITRALMAKKYKYSP